MAKMLATAINKNYRQFSEIKNIFGYYTDTDGKLCFGKIGSENVNDKIKAAFESTDMQVLLNSFLKDPSQGMILDPAAYGDVCDIPENILELSAVAQNAKMAFQSLPLEIRMNYGNDLYKFFTEVSNGDFKKKFVKSPKQGFESSGKTGGQSRSADTAGDAQSNGISTESKGKD